jgi:hypothetical protein
MALAFVPCCATEGYTVIECDIVTYLGGFSNYHAGSMIYKKSPADGRPGMNIDICNQARKPGKQTRQIAQAEFPQAMCDALHQNGMNARIGCEHFKA